MRAMMLKNGAGCEADAKRAIEDIAHLAEKKDREAIFLLGCCYLAGDNVPADPMKGAFYVVASPRHEISRGCVGAGCDV